MSEQSLVTEIVPLQVFIVQYLPLYHLLRVTLLHPVNIFSPKIAAEIAALMAYAQDKGLAIGEKDSAGHWLVERPGEFVRCLDYCPVRSVCPQLKREGLVPNE